MGMVFDDSHACPPMVPYGTKRSSRAEGRRRWNDIRKAYRALTGRTRHRGLSRKLNHAAPLGGYRHSVSENKFSIDDGGEPIPSSYEFRGVSCG